MCGLATPKGYGLEATGPREIQGLYSSPSFALVNIEHKATTQDSFSLACAKLSYALR